MQKTCQKCQKVFTRKESLAYHVQKNVCMKEQIAKINNNDNDNNANVDTDIDIDTDVNNILIPNEESVGSGTLSTKPTCKFCGKQFTTATNMYRHVNHTCRIKKNEDKNRDEIYDRLLKLEKENQLLKQEVSDIKRTVKVTKNVTHNTNNTKNITNNINRGTINNIVVVGYGHEDLTKLEKSELLKILQNGYYSTLKLTEVVHFNPKHPEYHNVYISNIKDKYAMMFDGNKWTLTTKEELINKIYDDKKNYIEENLEDFVESLTASRRKALDRWLETDDDDKKIREIKESIKLLLYNNKRIPLTTHKLKDEPLIEPADESAVKVVGKRISRSKKVIKDI
ncbi:hypothetical protein YASMINEVIRUS_1232 [Yasminevirus sp. GU-2018]|uniref:C2H2-type domain-containing protein n=1 Tax=Yasminevirus sp. GU-2018 TaxID=2420051 RepID=A0A5K0UAI3_9VIRU|nr:hypothetical protein YASMINEVIRUS_1232 [Yasminevirus sp. GU-2018]